MKVTFTDEQLRVINARGHNVLVSAAAGSGKTAVLVERIIRMILDKENPVDIDRLLVVTFTEAAAAEMRERIGKAISSELALNPDNQHLQKQASLLYRAQISTIHSFCLNVIRNNFNYLGIDPSFRIGDETELKLIMEDVLEELFEERYKSGNQMFLKTVDYFSQGTSDARLREYIFKLYDFSQGYPWPNEWLDRCDRYYSADAMSFNNSEWMFFFLSFVKTRITDVLKKINSLKKDILRPGGPFNYMQTLEADYQVVNDLLSCTTYDEYREALLNFKFPRLASRPGDGALDELVEKFKNDRDTYKNIISTGQSSSCLKTLFKLSSDDEIKKLNDIYPYVHSVLEIVKEFASRYEDVRKNRNIISFSDMEHLALNILYDLDDDMVHRPSQVAKAYQELFEEILMDEYQDCNRVQDLLMQSISGSDIGKENRFMVGDVKQSIYKFRLANPELFINKYNLFGQENNEISINERIDLHRNFRSRNEVIDSVNELFEKIMYREVGGVEYDDDARLVASATFPESKGNETEIIFLLKEETGNITRGDQEAKLIASRIRDIIKNNKVTDKHTGQLRKARYSDIVILLRSMTDVASSIKHVFSEEGIPYFMNLATGFFDTREIQQVLQLLKVIDNPRQDIPLYGVLTSYFGGLSDEEIAQIKVMYGKLDVNWCLYDCIKEEALTNDKISHVIKLLDDFRKRSVYTPIHQLISDIVNETGYLDYVTALSGGEQRRANINMLISKAKAYEATSFRGLFHFVRYIKQLKELNQDSGEADILDENADVVRVMTIHKSKGLEFPVCILAGAHKQFNESDIKGSMAIDLDYGIGASYIDLEKKIKNSPLLKRVVALKMQHDLVGEELRVLYVALTRAKEKLIITGVINDEEAFSKVLNESEELYLPGHRMDISLLEKSKSYMEFIRPLYRMVNITMLDKLNNQSVAETINRISSKGKLLKDINNNDSAVELLDSLNEKANREYSYSNLKDLVRKTSVSELKKAYLEDEKNEQVNSIFESNDDKSAIYEPRFIKGKNPKVSGTDRGTAYHKVMELLPFDELPLEGSLEELELKIKGQTDDFINKGLISKEWVKIVSLDKICGFLKTPLAKRMAEAQRHGKLKKEQPFVLGIEASKVNPEYPKEETVLLQGIIDAFFEEDGELVLVDYKTDIISTPEELMNRYHIQLDYYEDALERIVGKKVKESILYSFKLGSEVKKDMH